MDPLQLRQELLRPCNLDPQSSPRPARSFHQSIICRNKPACPRLLRKRQMQGVQSHHAMLLELASLLEHLLARRDGDLRRLEPKKRCQTAIFTRVPTVLEIMSRRTYQSQRSLLGRVQNRRYSLCFSPVPFDRFIIKRTFEAAEVEIEDLAHANIVLPSEGLLDTNDIGCSCPLRRLWEGFVLTQERLASPDDETWNRIVRWLEMVRVLLEP
jgi:hypothetical protein